MCSVANCFHSIFEIDEQTNHFLLIVPTVLHSCRAECCFAFEAEGALISVNMSSKRSVQGQRNSECFKTPITGREPASHVSVFFKTSRNCMQIVWAMSVDFSIIISQEVEKVQ